jgi:hypothetical protein
VAGPKAVGWLDALLIAAPTRRLNVKTFLVGEDYDPVDGVASFCTAYGIGEGGAMLARPDGFVGWRSAPRERPSPAVLGQVLDQLLGRA